MKVSVRRTKVQVGMLLAAVGLSASIPLLAESVSTKQALGTQRMVQRLANLTSQTDPTLNPFATEARIKILRDQLKQAPTMAERAEWQLSLGLELLSAGHNSEAAALFDELDGWIARGELSLEGGAVGYLRMQRAIAYLRLGEQENCRLDHNADRCLLPIQGSGIHRWREGSEKAQSVLLEQLRIYPRDLPSRWLLNIAVMTLGEYPTRVPRDLLIPPQVFQSEYPLPRFWNIATEAGVRMNDVAGGSITEDFDGDGWLDILFSSWDWQGQLRYFHNDGTGQFTDRTAAAGLLGLVGGLNMVQGDYNNDGFPDVFILRGAWFGEAGRHPNSLLKNNGDGSFSDVTEQAGLLSFHPTQTAVWFDFDNDGWLDLFVGNESSSGALVGGATARPSVHSCELFRNNHDGSFTECAGAAGVAVKAYVKGAVADDFNNDGRPDLYLSILDGPNLLFRNDGPAPAKDGSTPSRRFTEVGAAAGVTRPLCSFPAWFFDYDNDGWPDIFVTGYSTNFNFSTLSGIVADVLGRASPVEKPRLYHNNHDGTFKDVTEETRLNRVLYGMGANFGDLDTDGFLDFYIGTGDPNLGSLVPNRMFRNADGKLFQDVTTSGGFGQLQKGHGIAFADLNNDGHQEVVANLGGAYPGDAFHKALFANPRHGNRWLTLKLEGRRSNRSAIGARIKVVVRMDQGERAFFRTVSSGGSFGASCLRQQIGLGQALGIKRVEIRWPATGETQTLRGLEMDKFYNIKEGDPATRPWEVSTFQWPAPGVTHHSHDAAKF